MTDVDKVQKTKLNKDEERDNTPPETVSVDMCDRGCNLREADNIIARKRNRLSASKYWKAVRDKEKILKLRSRLLILKKNLGLWLMEACL